MKRVITAEKLLAIAEMERQWLSRFAARFRAAWREYGFQGIFIYGPQGSGKSTLALKLAYHALGSWQRALRALFFDPGELSVMLRAALRRMGVPEDILDGVREGSEEALARLQAALAGAPPEAREPLLIWDDAGVWASKYFFFRDKDYVMRVAFTVELARGFSAGLIVTATAPSRVLTALREQEWLFFRLVRGATFHVQSGGRFRGKVKVGLIKPYALSVLPDGRVRAYKYTKYVIPFVVKLPDDVYNQYKAMRDTYFLRAPSLAHRPASGKHAKEQEGEDEEES